MSSALRPTHFLPRRFHDCDRACGRYASQRRRSKQRLARKPGTRRHRIARLASYKALSAAKEVLRSPAMFRIERRSPWRCSPAQRLSLLLHLQLGYGNAQVLGALARHLGQHLEQQQSEFLAALAAGDIAVAQLQVQHAKGVALRHHRGPPRRRAVAPSERGSGTARAPKDLAEVSAKLELEIDERSQATGDAACPSRNGQAIHRVVA